MKKNFLFPLVLLHFGLLLSISEGAAQVSSLPEARWVKKLDERNNKVNTIGEELLDLLIYKDSGYVFNVLDELEKRGTDAGKYFKVRFKILKSFLIYNKDYPVTGASGKERVFKLLSQAMQLAYETGDEYLIAYTSVKYGSLMYAYGDLVLASMYYLNGVEGNDKLFGRNDNNNYWLIGEILFKSRDYEKTIYYSQKALANWTDTTSDSDFLMTKCLNTVALGFQGLGRYDSAFFYYNKAMLVAKKMSNEVWRGIVSGNMGQIYFIQKKYDSAKLLLEYDYRISRQLGYFDNAGNSLQWAARVNLALGDKQLALIQVKEAFNLLQKWQGVSSNYLQNAYYTAAETYRALGIADSVYYYSGKYMALHDSIERVVTLSSNNIAKMRFSNEKNRQFIQNIQAQKEKEEQQRNVIIVGILLLASVALLFSNKKRLQFKYKEELAQQLRLAAEAEVGAAKEQLKMFTSNIIDKTSLIEKLEQQLQRKELSNEQQRMITEISNQTILTENDWEKFKHLFEKIYPGFFISLKETTPDITLAELRMAALTRLQLTSRQMAAILGISVDSIHKSRQRLRHRFHLTTESNLEEFITGL